MAPYVQRFKDEYELMNRSRSRCPGACVAIGTSMTTTADTNCV